MGIKPILEMNHVSKVYGNGVYANKDISFSVNEGEIHALVGENGAGKSTLMKILFGMEKPSHGEILLNDKKVVFHSPQDAMAVGIGMVHQHFKLVESMSVTENVILGYEPMRRGVIDLKTAREKVSEIIKIFNLEKELDIPVGKLPVGTKQKVEIAKALYRGAKILILDEPTAVLTPQETSELFIQLKDLKKQGFTVIFISHKLREVKEISDRISIMKRGQLVDTCNTKEVTQEIISEKMVGSGYTANLPKKPSKLQEPLLCVKDLSAKGAGTKNVVNKVSFTARAGEIVGIAGVEGNGQGELIELLTGLRRAEEGNVLMYGNDIRGMDVKQLRDLGMSYIPSDRMSIGLATSMSIEENLITTKLEDKTLYRHHLLSTKQSGRLSAKLVKEYLIKCASPQTEVNMLSGGNMQKVVVAREFTQGSKIIIAEQPTRGIDVGAARFIHEELLRLRDNGCAVLLVSADMEELYKLSDSIFVMYDGEISAYIRNPELVSENELGLYMLGVSKQTNEEIKGAYYEK